LKKLFYVDPVSNSHYFWNDLLKELNQAEHFINCLSDPNYYFLISNLILSLAIDEPVIIIDGNCTIKEKEFFISCLNPDDLRTYHVDLDIKNTAELRRMLLKPKTNWTITLFTSGTEGKPKKVVQTWERLIKNVNTATHHRKDIWGLAYNPAHIAGIQVLLQAIYNLNTIVRLFGSETYNSASLLAKYKVSHISATSSYYRQMMPLNEMVESVRSVTFGGEKINMSLMNTLKMHFPSAKFINIYATSEAGTLLKSENDIFTIQKKDVPWFKIINGKLHIHKSMVSNSFIFDGEWYNSGDQVEITSQSPELSFRFMKRGHDFVSIGGYTVHLEEVKNSILELEDVNDARVYTKENSVLGNILLCDIATDNENMSEMEVREKLRNFLTEYKIPRVFKFYKHIPLGRTGKSMI
jgi:acyl-coenzyme A synthetase/AMP-(fatty) acid ligase